MVQELIEQLPLPQRLALAYAPRRTRAHFLALLAFDARLGQSLRQANEPIMAQMRLAWWRDQLRLAPEMRERSDLLMSALDILAGAEDRLLALIDGWETICSEDIDIAVISGFAQARGRAIAALAELTDTSDEPEAVERAGEQWALGDLAAGMGNAEERVLVLKRVVQMGTSRVTLSKALRPLVVLEGLARRSIANGGKPLLDGPASSLLAMRLGLFGR